MSWKDNLIGEALKIAESPAARLRVMAGPGTGKSFAMKRRIMRLIEEGVEPDRILAITFTRVAASDLKKELHDLGIEGAEKINAMTLHAFCFGLLNQKDVFQKVGRIARPLKSFTKKGYPQFEISPLLADLDLQGAFKRSKFKLIKAFEAAWAKNQNSSVWAALPIEELFEKELIKWLKSHNAILIGELVPLTLKYIENNPASNIFDRYSQIVVDEYQDLNKAEQVLIDRLGHKCAISIVGDIDQSIYSFRYAHPEGIIDFGYRHQGVEDYELKECRRCGKDIVNLADLLIKNNHESNSTRLSSCESNSSGKVVTVQWSSMEREAQGIAELVKNLIDEKGYAPKDILILSPRRLLAYKLKDCMAQYSLPVHSFFHEEAVEDGEAQKAVTLLNLLVNPNDAVALRFWLGFGSNNWRAKQYSILLEGAEKHNISTREFLDSCISGDIEFKNISDIKNAYLQLNSNVLEMENKSLPEVIDFIFPEGKESTSILREVSLLFIANNSDSTLEGLWDCIVTILTQSEMPEEGDFIRIMSLHKSKGLTSKVTIITSCIEGLIPMHKKGNASHEDNDNLQEQRRLFYVGLTRAKEVLVISSFIKIPCDIAYNIGAKFSNYKTHAEVISSRFMGDFKGKIKVIDGDHWKGINFDWN